MNMLIPPLIASVMVTGYVSVATLERSQGADRVFAADNMVRHHTAARTAVEAMKPLGIVTAPVPVTDPDMRPFVPVLDWKTVIAKDSSGQLWAVTYLDDAGYQKPSQILDWSAASVPFELAKTRFSDGTYGAWVADTRTITTTIGNITFEAASAPPIPNGMPVIASLIL